MRRPEKASALSPQMRRSLQELNYSRQKHGLAWGQSDQSIPRGGMVPMLLTSVTSVTSVTVTLQSKTQNRV